MAGFHLTTAGRFCLPADNELRWTLLGEEERTVGASGIRFHALHFVAPELNGLVGERVAVRFRPHDDTSIEVFRRGRHLCTALPQGLLRPDERAALLAQRRADAAEQARRQRRATRRLQPRLSPATAHQEAVDVAVVSRAATGPTPEGDDLRRLAHTDLLHLVGRTAAQ